MNEVYPSPLNPPTLLIYPFKIATAVYGPFPAVGRNRNRLITDGGDPYKMVPQKKWLGNPKTSKTYQFFGRKKYFPLPTATIKIVTAVCVRIRISQGLFTNIVLWYSIIIINEEILFSIGMVPKLSQTLKKIPYGTTPKIEFWKAVHTVTQNFKKRP